MRKKVTVSARKDYQDQNQQEGSFPKKRKTIARSPSQEDVDQDQNEDLSQEDAAQDQEMAEVEQESDNISQDKILPDLKEYGGPTDLSLLKNFKGHVAYAIRANKERGTLGCRYHQSTFYSWELAKEPDFVQNKVKNSGLYNFLQNLPQYVNTQLVSSFVERWHPETTSFHLPFGEMTITLDDVQHITGLSVVGKPVTKSSLRYNDVVNVLVDYLGVSVEQAKEELKKTKCFFVRSDWVRDLFCKDPKKPKKKARQELVDGSAPATCESLIETEAEKLKRLECRTRGYLFYLLGSILFCNRSGNRMPVYVLKCLKNLEKVSKYAWGSGCLAFLYHELRGASKWKTKQMAGFLPLLEVWIHEHFKLCGKLNPTYQLGQPRMKRYLSHQCAGDGKAGIVTIREYLDDLSAHDVIWEPYKQLREQYPFVRSSWYTGCVIFFDFAEPYHPQRVLRQFGRVQTIPKDPIPAESDGKRTSYKIISSYLQNWENHLLASEHRSREVKYPWDCNLDYMDWFMSVSHPYVQDITIRGSGSLRETGACFSAMRGAIVDAMKLMKDSLKDSQNSKIKDAIKLLRDVRGPVMDDSSNSEEDSEHNDDSSDSEEETPKDVPTSRDELEADVQRPECKRTNGELQTYKSKGRKTKGKQSVEEGKEEKRYFTRGKDQEDKKKEVAAEKNAEVVELESNYTEKGENFPKMRNIIESRHYRYFEIDEQKAKLANFFSFGHKYSIAYEDDDLKIEGKMVEDLMFDKFTDSEVIDFYSKWLSKKNPFGKNIKCIFVTSLAWTHLKQKRTKCVKRVLHGVLEKELADDVKYVFFPMNTSKSAFPNEGFHWTLLVLNYTKKAFEHYNSLKPRKGSVDKFYEEARLLKIEVVNWIDQYRVNKKLPKISWPIEIATPPCPQQGNTADCGLYVCRIMEALSSGEKLPNSKDFRSNVDELKPTLTGLILGDKEHSWELDKE